MPGSIDINQETVLDLGRKIVERAAPDEVFLFDIQSAAYLADPIAAVKPERDRGDLLGIGVTEVLVPILTPIALAVAAEVTKYLSVKLIRPAIERTGEVTSDVIRRLFRIGGHDGGPILEVPPDERMRIRMVVVDVVVGHRHTEEVAQLIADVLIGVNAEDVSVDDD